MPHRNGHLPKTEGGPRQRPYHIDNENPNPEVLATMHEEFVAFCEGVAKDRDLDISVDNFWYFAPVEFNASDDVKAATEKLGYSHMDIYAGAGHDACYMADLVPSGMIFTPCENGISHNEIEYSSPEQCEAGANVLLHTMLTASHRIAEAAGAPTEESEEEISLLNNINDTQGKFTIYNSLLSEYGVLGFEYGYAMADPKSLTIWEAQFGDFSNGAQIIIDQYLFSGEAKWKTQNGLVLFLPHGYEGQGAEHSSARMERYLQLCAKDNVFVANCTTPANMFHILRRQLKANYRKPLIIFTPKSLLRHPMVHSSVDDFTKGEFNLLIDDNSVSVEDVKSVVFVSGKFYYDILEERERQGRNDVAIVRLEQLFPLPKEHIKSIIKKYKNADDIVWAQEEPINMGAYAHLLINLKESRNFRVAARRFYSATAAGSSARYLKRHKEVIDFIFDKNKNNQIPE